MQAEERPMQRLGQGGEHASSMEARAGAFLGEARSTVGISEIEIAAIERRLLGRRRVGWGLRLWPALAAIVVLLVAGSVMAVVSGWRPRLPFVGATSQTEAPSGARPAKVRPTHKVVHEANRGASEPSSVQPSNVPTAAEFPAAPATAPAPETHPSFVVRRAPRQELSSASLSAAPAGSLPSEGPLSAEARSLSDALARWRRDGNAEAALVLLGAHERRFPNGSFSVECKVARAEILLALNRRAQALVVLDSLSLGGLPRARELQTIRGELRVQAGRCQDARADLARVLVGGGDDDSSRRAARAMASCP
jgi:hypothetical protein